LAKNTHMKFHDNPSSGTQVVRCGRTDGWHMWQLIVTFAILGTCLKMDCRKISLGLTLDWMFL